MDSELLIIFPGIIIMLIVIGLSVNGVVSKVIDYKKSQMALGDTPKAALRGELDNRTTHIEDRLAVLERIATDRGQLLSDEIDALRGSIAQTEKKEAN